MRRADWASRMFAVMDEHAGRTFAWGENDCCLFAARVVDAMTDGEHEAGLQAIYQDEAGALAFIESAGSLVAAVSSFLGEPSEARATRGDVVMFDGGLSDAVGICVGSYVVGMGPDGLHKLPRAEIKQVWKPWEK